MQWAFHSRRHRCSDPKDNSHPPIRFEGPKPCLLNQHLRTSSDGLFRHSYATIETDSNIISHLALPRQRKRQETSCRYTWRVNGCRIYITHLRSHRMPLNFPKEIRRGWNRPRWSSKNFTCLLPLALLRFLEAHAAHFQIQTGRLRVRQIHLELAAAIQARFWIDR